MQMTKPFFGKLRRTYSPGIWLHCRESTTLCYLQGYIHRIQVLIVFTIIIRDNNFSCPSYTDRQSTDRSCLSGGSTSQSTKNFCELRWKPQIETLLRILISEATQIEEHHLQVQLTHININNILIII